MIKREPNQPGELRISRFQPGKEDKRTIVSNSIASVIGGIVSVGGGYGDVIAVLRLAKSNGYLSDQFAIDPLPNSVRTYYRDEEGDDSEQPAEAEDRRRSTPSLSRCDLANHRHGTQNISVASGPRPKLPRKTAAAS